MPRPGTITVVMLAIALGAAGCAARAQEDFSGVIAPILVDGTVGVYVGSAPVRIDEPARAVLGGAAARANGPDQRGSVVTVTGIIDNDEDDRSARALATLRARAVRDFLVDIGGVTPSRIRWGIARRPGVTGNVLVEFARPGLTTMPGNRVVGTRPMPPLRASDPHGPNAFDAASPSRGFQQRPGGNGCAYSRHDLDDFEPGGPFRPCSPPTL